MEYRFLSKNKIKISALGYGCWALGGHGWGLVNNGDLSGSVYKALESGINFFDTADVYGLGRSEIFLSKILGKNRHKVVIATKGGIRFKNGKTYKDNSVSYIRKAVEDSLRRLRVETIPLYYIHSPDGVTPIKEIIGEMVRLREEGKIQAIGMSNFSPKKINTALSITQIDAVQMRWNLLYPQEGNSIISICEKHKILLVAWGVLADGLLTGKFTAETHFGLNDHRSQAAHFQGKKFLSNLKRVSKLSDFARQHSVPLCQVALRWVIDHSSSACALFGAKRPDQVDLNIAALNWKMSSKELDEINRLMRL